MGTRKRTLQLLLGFIFACSPFVAERSSDVFQLSKDGEGTTSA